MGVAGDYGGILVVIYYAINSIKVCDIYFISTGNFIDVIVSNIIYRG